MDNSATYGFVVKMQDLIVVGRELGEEDIEPEEAGRVYEEDAVKRTGGEDALPRYL